MTNSNLITVFNGQISNQQVQLCDARSLHTFLENGKQYADWIKKRITDYGFIQDEDYIIVTERTNGRPRKEYHITLDMGKELAMVERNEKGRMIRKYFIECERKALQQSQQITLPEPEKQYQHSFIEHELQRLAWLWFACYNNLELFEQMATPLQKLGSHFGTRAYTHAVEYKRVLRDSHNIIKRITQDFDVSTWGDENWNRVLPTIRNFNPKPTHYALTRR